MRLGLTIFKFSYLLVRHRKWLYSQFNKVTSCFWFGSSRPSLKVHEVKCVSGDPAIMCPVLFKGSRSPLSLAVLYVAYCTLRPYLVRWYLVFCRPCCVTLVGTALYICLLFCVGLSLFIISGLYVYVVVCVVYAYNLTWGVPEKWQKQGRAKWVLSCFCYVVKKSHSYFGITPFKFELFREIFFEFRLVYSQSMSDRFSAHVRPVIHISFRHVFQICLQYI